ncbi:hypothetical protein ACFL23_04685 [Patescibacteria group bacterium]
MILLSFFFIFLFWILGSWLIIKQVDKIDREARFIFNDKNYRITDIEIEEVEDSNTGVSKNKKILKLELE